MRVERIIRIETRLVYLAEWLPHLVLAQLYFQMVWMAFLKKIVLGRDIIGQLWVEHLRKTVEEEVWLILLKHHHRICWCWEEYLLAEHVGNVGQKGHHGKDKQDNPALTTLN